jgi:hypothetical protein
MRKPWSSYDEEVIKRHYAATLTADLAALLGRSKRSIYQRARELGLEKDRAWIAATARQRVEADPNHGSRRSRIQPGAAPWNKGVPGSTGTQPGCRATQFAPGRPANEARNYRPIGSLRLSKDGYLERKVTDDPAVYPTRRWVAVHRLVWEAAHGRVPAGHIVVFRRGLRTTDPEQITTDRLECISRVENMRRNTYHQYGPDVAAVVQLRGAITRQINKRTKEAA